MRSRGAVALDRGNHVQGLAGLQDVVGAEDPCAEPRAHRGRRQRARQPVVHADAEGPPTKSFREADISTGQPVAVSSPSRLVTSRDCRRCSCRSREPGR